MARRRKHSGGDCTPRRISFKAHGKTVTFMGRPGGMKSAGGVCPDKKRSTKHLGTYKRALAKAAHACAGKSHARRGKKGVSAYNKCVGQKLK